jgi:acetyltransferase
LLKLLVQVARDEKLSSLHGMIMSQNVEMQHVAEKLGFKLERELSESTVQARIEL